MPCSGNAFTERKSQRDPQFFSNLRALPCWILICAKIIGVAGPHSAQRLSGSINAEMNVQHSSCKVLTL